MSCHKRTWLATGVSGRHDCCSSSPPLEGGVNGGSGSWHTSQAVSLQLEVGCVEGSEPELVIVASASTSDIAAFCPFCACTAGIDVQHEAERQSGGWHSPVQVQMLQSLRLLLRIRARQALKSDTISVPVVQLDLPDQAQQSVLRCAACQGPCRMRLSRQGALPFPGAVQALLWSNGAPIAVHPRVQQLSACPRARSSLPAAATMLPLSCCGRWPAADCGVAAAPSVKHAASCWEGRSIRRNR